MAIVNITPDSFFDGGRWMAERSVSPNASVVVSHCRRWVQAGAEILDLGGESTRPGASPVDEEHERRRLLPVIERLRGDELLASVPISVDTRHAAVARVALEAGAAIVNDVSGLADPDMASVVADSGAGLVINHMRGDPQTMQRDISFAGLFREVAEELTAAVERALDAGVARERIVVDPGIGFGKDAEQSAALVGSGAFLRGRTGCPVLIGASRKSFLGALTDREVDDRLLGSISSALVAVAGGADVVRVHDVGETVEALRVHCGIHDAMALHGGGAEGEGS
jgi:dihydropteroate synthase